MEEKKDVAEVVPAPAEAPALPATEPDEKPVETEDNFVEESLGEPKQEVAEEKTPEAEPVAPVTPKKQASAEPVVDEKKDETPPAQKPEIRVEPEAKVSRLDRRIAQKYAENLVLRGSETPSAEQIEAELATMTADEKKNALRNLLDDNRSLRGQKPEPLSYEDEEAIIEAEVERRYQEEQKAIFEKNFQEDLIATLTAHPELDNRTEGFNPKIEKAVAQIVQSGMLASEAYDIVINAVKTAAENERKETEREKQSAMAGSVIAPPVSEPVIHTPETDEDKFISDALG